MFKKNVLLLMMVAVFVFIAGCSNDDDGEFPQSSIEVIVPYSAGGPGDTSARLIADALADELDVTVNVLNREGAGGEIGITEIASSEPDGYTLGIFGYPDSFILEKTVDTDFVFEDMEYFAAFDEDPMGIYASPTSSFTSIEDIIQFGEENPGEITISESGSLGLMNALEFSSLLGIETTPVAFEGGGDNLNALLGNHVDLASTSSGAHDDIIESGGTLIGFAASERLESFPDSQTFQEQGYDMEMIVSRVVVAPKGVSDEVKETLSSALDNIGNSAALKESFENANLPYRYLDYESVNEFLEDYNNRLESIIGENMDN